MNRNQIKQKLEKARRFYNEYKKEINYTLLGVGVMTFLDIVHYDPKIRKNAADAARLEDVHMYYDTRDDSKFLLAMYKDGASQTFAWNDFPPKQS